MTCPTFTFLFPSSQKTLKNDFFNIFIPKNSFSDQINPIDDMPHDIPCFHIFVPKYPKKLSKMTFSTFFIPKNSFSDQINPINDMQHAMPHFHIFVPK